MVKNDAEYMPNKDDDLPGLSVVIITKNEEHNIRDCIDGVKWADEIIVDEER